MAEVLINPWQQALINLGLKPVSHERWWHDVLSPWSHDGFLEHYQHQLQSMSRCRPPITCRRLTPWSTIGVLPSFKTDQWKWDHLGWERTSSRSDRRLEYSQVLGKGDTLALSSLSRWWSIYHHCKRSQCSPMSLLGEHSLEEGKKFYFNRILPHLLFSPPLPCSYFDVTLLSKPSSWPFSCPDETWWDLMWPDVPLIGPLPGPYGAFMLLSGLWGTCSWVLPQPSIKPLATWSYTMCAGLEAVLPPPPGVRPLLPQDLCLLKTEHVVHNLPTLQLCPDLLEVSPTSV